MKAIGHGRTESDPAVVVVEQQAADGLEGQGKLKLSPSCWSARFA